MAALLAGVSATPVVAAVLTVGPGQQYTTIAGAIATSQDGDTVNVLAGTYVNDFAEIRTKIALIAVGGQVRMLAQGLIPNGKGILVTDTDVTITGFMFSGARVADANGAGIRYQGGKLVLDRCYFLNNQNGLLGAADPAGTITVTNSEFAHNGAASGSTAGYTHNIYVGAIATFEAENSYFHDANVGHQIKSRAYTTIVNNSRVVDGPAGTGSYSIDLPNGGNVTITNNQIEQGPRGGNPAMIAFGEEGGVYAGSTLVVQRNLIENDLASVSSRGVWNATTITAQITDNAIYGLTSAQLVSGPANVAGTVTVTKEPPISTRHPWAK